MYRLVFALALLISALGVAAPPAAAAEPFCADGQAPHFSFGIADLKTALGEAMGDPLECEHASSASGDTLQQTTTGLAMYRQSTNAPEFTDGWHHWALSAGGLVAWTGDLDPTASPPAWGSAPSGATVAAAPTVDAPPTANAGRQSPPAAAPTATPPPPAPASATRCVDLGGGACFNAVSELADTVTLLAHSSTAAPLLKSAAKAGYVVHYGDLPPDVLGLFRPSGHDVILNTLLKSYPTLDRGPVLAHELQHVTDWLTQGAALETTGGCLATEVNAFHTESSTWLELHGGHLTSPSNDLEREFNMITQAIASDPAAFASRLTVVYHAQCTATN